ncbi:MAG: cation-translocating P-type ATPase [Planctomycetes bacterium]|nr:cation-translocating P-type ATPase [Planctomycetota bacterium]
MIERLAGAREAAGARWRAFWRDLRLRRRRVWARGGRAYLELRELAHHEHRRFDAAARDALEALEGIEWARVNAALGRLVVSYDEARWPDPLELVRRVEEVEERLGHLDLPFAPDPPEHPGDVEPFVRGAITLGADALGLGLGLALRVVRSRPEPIEVDLAALTAALQHLPRARAAVERRLGSAVADLSLGLLAPLTSGLVRGWSGPIVDALGRGLRLRELLARRDCWTRLEPALGAHHEHQRCAAPTRRERPAPLREGPIERYAEGAQVATLGGFGFGLATTQKMESASASLVSGVPRPARLGREAFSSWLAVRLARRDVLVLRPRALRRLDRIDWVAVEEDLLAPRRLLVADASPLGWLDRDEAVAHAAALLAPTRPDEVQRAGAWSLGPIDALAPGRDDLVRRGAALAPEGARPLLLARGGAPAALVVVEPAVDPLARALVAAVRRAGLRLALLGDGEGADWVAADARLPARVDPDLAVQSLQADGAGVLVVTSSARGGLGVADVGLGIAREGRAPPWEADLLVRDGLGAALLLVEAARGAREAAHQSVNLAAAEAGMGLLLSLTDLEPRTVRRLMLLADVASLLALLNGVRLARGVVDPGPAVAREAPRWHALLPDEVLERLRSAPEGLAGHEAAARRAPAARRAGPVTALARAVWGELDNPLTPILGGAAAVAAAVGSATDAALVGAVVGVNALVGAAQRLRVEALLARLDRSERRTVRVRRGGREEDLPAEELVPGDVLRLGAGDVVPADCRVLEAAGLEVDESALTGESLPIAKGPAPSGAVAVAERTSMLHEGTSLAAGEATAVVVAVGEATEARRGLAERPARRSGVEARLDELTALTVPVAAGGGVALLASTLLRGGSTRQALGSAVSLGVAAVPEGLPLLATLAQLSAARRLSERGVLVRDPRGIEALGRVDVLCADKTGTLTHGRIRLALVDDGEADAAPDALGPSQRGVLAAGLRACPRAEAGQPLAHVTDRALVDGARAAGVEPGHGLEGWTRVDELPFEPGRGFHAVVGRVPDRGEVLCLKGAPEAVLERCDRWRGGAAPLDDAARRRLTERVDRLARRGLRLLAVAEGPANGWRAEDEGAIRGLALQGFVGFADPVRATARQAVADLRQAGVTLLMATGDHPSTAESIAAELGVLDGGDVLTGPELDALDDDALAARLAGVTVLARATPAQKARLVAALRRAGRVVAMAGDGANDAPAIRAADVGIAIGAASTGAARAAADLVVTDERIETLVDAVLEGRALWRSVREAVSILVGGNLGEIGFTVLGGLTSGQPPLNTRQLLLVNLLTDALPALAVAVSPPARVSPEQLLGEGPEASLGEALNRDITWRAVVTGLAAWGAWLPARFMGPRASADTVGLVGLVGAQLGQTIVVGGRDPRVLLAGLGSLGALLAVVETPGVSQFFGCRPLGPLGLLQAGTAAAAATGAAAVLPGALERARALAARSGALERLERSEVGRMFRESRLLTRLRREGAPGEAPRRRFQVMDLLLRGRDPGRPPA